MNKRRVVITGIGAITPVGHNVAQTWESLVNGVSGVDLISKFDYSNLPVHIAAEVKNYDPEEHFDHKEVKKLDLYTQFAMIAAREAIADAGLIPGSFNPDRTGVITGAGIGGILTFEEECIKNYTQGPRRISPFFIPKMIGNIAAAHISIENNFKGLNFNVMSACASANHALGTAFRSIQYGDADIILSGGTEAAVTPLSVGGFSAMRALSTRNNEPQKASRPFDAERDGFVMSEGAAILVLEELEHALARGAKIYAELVGYGASEDAFHITAPTEDGEGSSRAMLMAIQDAGLKPKDIDYISGHLTATSKDATEIQNLSSALNLSGKDFPYINSLKALTGHCLSAAASVECVATVLQLSENFVAPNINCEDLNPEISAIIDADCVPQKLIEKEINIAAKVSFGFGDVNGCIIFKKYS